MRTGSHLQRRPGQDKRKHARQQIVSHSIQYKKTEYNMLHEVQNKWGLQMPACSEVQVSRIVGNAINMNRESISLLRWCKDSMSRTDCSEPVLM